MSMTLFGWIAKQGNKKITGYNKDYNVTLEEARKNNNGKGFIIQKIGDFGGGPWVMRSYKFKK